MSTREYVENNQRCALVKGIGTIPREELYMLNMLLLLPVLLSTKSTVMITAIYIVK